MSPTEKRYAFRFAIVLVGLLLAFAVWWSMQEKPIDQPVSVSSPGKQKPPVSQPRPIEIVDHPILEQSSKFQTPSGTPEEDFEMVSSLLESYRRVFEGNPVGENEEIFAALRGKNPKGIRFLSDDFPGLQASGVVHDRWGTPWRFHAISGKEMEVISAGPDREFGTKDDVGLVTQP